MKPRCFAILLFVLAACQKRETPAGPAETEPPILTAHYTAINPAAGGYYCALPAHYNTSGKNYPLLLFIHGLGQLGTGSRSSLPEVLTEAIPELLYQKSFPPSFRVAGADFSFIVLAPQFNRMPRPEDVWAVMAFAKKEYRIDTTRIYLSGFSAGSVAACDVAAAYAPQIAAFVGMSGVSQSGDIAAKCALIAQSNLPLWIFHNNGDKIIVVKYARDFIATLTSLQPAIEPKYTELLPFGLNNHDSWTVASDPAYKETGLNIYEWMLHYHR